MKPRSKTHRTRQTKLRFAPRHALTLIAAAAVVGLLIALMASDGAMAGVQVAFARITRGILNLFGHPTEVVGSSVQSSGFGITVVTACTGLFTTTLFLLAVTVFPTTWAAKLVGALIGVGGIFVLNVIRLVSLYYIGLHWPTILDTVHQLVWQSLLIVFAVSLWLLWAAWIAPRRGRAGGSRKGAAR